MPGLQRLRDSLMAQLTELTKAKPRGHSDDTILSDLQSIESSIALKRDEMVQLLSFP